VSTSNHASDTATIRRHRRDFAISSPPGQSVKSLKILGSRCIIRDHSLNPKGEFVMDYHALEKMTVVKLREEAKKYDVKGVTGMKKEELVTLLADKLGVEKPHGMPKKTKKVTTPLDKAELKKKIIGLKEQREKARSDKDKKKITLLGRRIHSLKRQMRKIA
jgi:hypothetical protein